MNSTRRFVAVVACLMLATHVLGGVVWPAALFCTSSAANELVCTCTHGPDAECPMHKHQRMPQPGPHCRACGQTDDVMPLPLFTWAGVVVRAAAATPRGDCFEPMPIAVEAMSDRASVPASPPPRVA